jgi:formiminoglutamase
MTWDSRYLPPDTKLWQGRPDLNSMECFFQVVQLLNLLGQIPPLNSKYCFALLGFCCDEGIRRNYGRTGAVEGPFAIREMLARMAVPRTDMVLYDAGDIICPDGDLESAQTTLAHAIQLLLQHHIIPIVVGGGHEIAWGHYQGIFKQYPTQTLGIINFDAHFDMRPLSSDHLGSSGTPFLQIAYAEQQAQRQFHYTCVGIQSSANIPSLYTTAKQFNTRYVSANDMYLHDPHYAENAIRQSIETVEKLYTSICLDVFASAYAPGVSASNPMGLTPWQVIPLLRQLAASRKALSYDIAELSPKYDLDQRTAKLAACLIVEIIQHHQ